MEVWTLFNGAANPNNKYGNPHIKASPMQRTLDVTYGNYANGVRATYKSLNDGVNFESEPCEVMFKDRLADINIKSGANKFFRTDVRISCNKENPLDASALIGKGRVFERIKERNSFKFASFSLDMTKTIQKDLTPNKMN